jgi:hypothetical protein
MSLFNGWCDVMCDVMWRDVTWCDVMWRDVVFGWEGMRLCEQPRGVLLRRERVERQPMLCGELGHPT